ncbi:WYL domain-containing protein [Cellulomonas hominis]|uniref:helix-turn-helix transcriptional regulator n=1 Tax=Cellulomonas hominis TaxID=156981 RepID=UPI001C10A5E9|nr:WYL domain-containing protein [Cellulomonas hominis]MBU5423603.1 WYL domain-containing protein [Cellulomonas hominis]
MSEIAEPTTPSSRLLALLSLLQTRRDWPGEVLAGRLGVSPRTVRRDVDRLRALGYPVHATKGPDGGYRLAAGTAMPPLMLDDEQVVALTVALQTASTGVDGLDDAAARALATLRQVLPARLRARVEGLELTAVRRTEAPEEERVDTERLMAVGAAVRAREVLRFDYRSPDAGGTGPTDRTGPAAPADGPPRRVEPHHLVTRGRRWYLVAWDLDRADWRTFRVDRLHPRTPTGPRFERRAVPAPDVAAYLQQQFSGVTFPCHGEAVLEAPASVVSRWAGTTDVVEPLDAQRCRVVAGSWSWGGLAAWFGLFDVPLTIVGPAELRDAARALAGRYAAATGDGRASG